MYDLETDPHEVHNLAGDPDYQDTLVDLRGRLDAWIETTGDQGETPEDEQL